MMVSYSAEYETIIGAGLDLQLDCPDLALSRHMLFADLSDEEFIKVANMHVEALNHALENVPQDRVRVHICWGNYEGPFVIAPADMHPHPVLGHIFQRMV